MYSFLYHLLDAQLIILPIILPVSLFLIRCYYNYYTSSVGKRTPPGSLGLPLIGETFRFLRAVKNDTAHEWLESRVSKYGTIFKTSLMGMPTIVMASPSGNRFLFTSNENIIGSNQPSSVNAILGNCNIFELKGNEHKLVREAMSSFLKLENLRRCVGDMDAAVKLQIFQEFNGKDRVTTVPVMKRITFNVSCKILFDLPIGKEVESLLEDFTTALKGIWSLPVNIPFTDFSRALASRKRMYKYFSGVINERKRKLAEGTGVAENNMIDTFLNSRDANGEIFSYDMIIDNIVTLMFASHDTSTVVLVQLIKQMARDKSIYENILEEQMRVLREKKGKDEKLTWEDIQKMKYTWRVAQETMRVVPPVFGNFKRAVTDTSFGGFDIPKGWQLFWVSCATHLDKNIFPEPEKIDPSRFEIASRSHPPFSYIPFGGGTRSCPGNVFSRIVVLILVHHLILNYEWSHVIPDEQMTGHPMPYPSMGLPITVHPKTIVED